MFFCREIDKEEFKKVMALMRLQNRQGAKHRDGLRTGFKVSGSVENGGLVDFFFGKDGTDRLKVEKFVKFLVELHEEVDTSFSHLVQTFDIFDHYICHILLTEFILSEFKYQ